MFRHLQKDSFSIPRILCVYAGILVFVVAVFAQPPEENGAVSKLTDLLQLIAVTVIVVAGLIGTIYGIWNRKKYDGLLAIITEKDLTIESLEEQNEREQKKCIEQKQNDANKLTIEIQKVVNLTVSNESVVAMNLQMKAILKNLRQADKWDGHEDRLFG